MLLGLTSTDQTMWTITLVLGVVVLAVVATLLMVLYRTVQRIQEGVRAVWEAATRVAENTATTWQLTKTVHHLRHLETELAQHAEVLARRR